MRETAGPVGKQWKETYDRRCGYFYETEWLLKINVH